MEFQARRIYKQENPKFALKKHKQFQNLQTNVNSTMHSSLQNSAVMTPQQLQQTILNTQIRAKASLLLSLPLTPRPSNISNLNNDKHANNEPRKSSREAKLSLMYSPKKKITISQITESFRRRRKITRGKMGEIAQMRRTGSQNFFGSVCKNSYFELKQQKQQIQNTNPDQAVQFHPKTPVYLSTSRPRINFFSLSQYFLLVFSKILSRPGKQKIYSLIEQLSMRYEKYPETIAQDVIDIRRIASKLILALGPKETYVELKPFEALEVDGEFARLVFHMVHDVTARKYNSYDLVKIYKEIEYCARRLEFYKFTLKVCFEFGQIYKQQFDQLNSHAYYAKALKLAIFLNDKFYEEKAVDCFGMNAYSSNKSGQAYYYHENVSKLCLFQRQMIHQKYSNNDQIQKINSERQQLRTNSPQIPKIPTLFSHKKQSFNFQGPELPIQYQQKNRRKFKQNISSYIQCPVMRSNTLIARGFMNRIDGIGKKRRTCKNWNAVRGKGGFNFGEDLDNSEVVLTHRSLNRKNPEFEMGVVEKERKVLLELIGYYTNTKIDPVL